MLGFAVAFCNNIIKEEKKKKKKLKQPKTEFEPQSFFAAGIDSSQDERRECDGLDVGTDHRSIPGDAPERGIVAPRQVDVANEAVAGARRGHRVRQRDAGPVGVARKEAERVATSGLRSRPDGRTRRSLGGRT